MDIIHGYEVTQFALFNNGRGMALASNPAAVSPFVTWQFTEEDGKCDYYWGHYVSGEDTAAFDFIHRVNDYQRRYGVGLVKIEPENALQARYCYFSTQRPVDLGTFPKTEENTPLLIQNFEQRKPVQEGAFLAWGELAYPKPLTRKEMSDYELKAAQDNPERPAMKHEKQPGGKHHTKQKNHPRKEERGDR